MKTHMVKGCRHIMPTGRNCHSPALRGMAYCHSHQKLHKALNRSKHSNNHLQLASIEEPGGIQLAITQVFDALGKARIDDRKAHILMYGLQLATQLAAKTACPSQVRQDACPTPLASQSPPENWE